MPKIRFVKSPKVLEVHEGENLMHTLLDGDVAVASSCGGDGVCGKCRIEVKAGAENLSSENETEASLREKFILKASERISCQCTIIGDLTLDTPYW